MTLAPKRLLIVAGIAVGFMLLYRLEWPGFWIGGPFKPTVLALSAVLAAHFFRVASWPLVIAFGLLTFALDAVDSFVGAAGPVTGATPGAQLNRAGIAAATWIFSPITLIGPMAVAVVAHLVLSKMRPNTSLERTRDR